MKPTLTDFGNLDISFPNLSIEIVALRLIHSLKGTEPDMDIFARRRPQPALCVVLVVVCSLLSMGCLSLSFGNWTSHTNEDPSVLSQTGNARVAKGQIADIYYPVPYVSAPNVELDDMFHNYEIVEQKADHFRVRNKSGTFDVKWTARGVRTGQPAITVPTTTVTTAATNPGS